MSVDLGLLENVYNATFPLCFWGTGAVSAYATLDNIGFVPNYAMVCSIKCNSTQASDGRIYGIWSNLNNDYVGTFVLPGTAVGGSWSNPNKLIFTKRPIQSIFFNLFVIDNNPLNLTFGKFIPIANNAFSSAVSVELGINFYLHKSVGHNPNLVSINPNNGGGIQKKA
jgi:hypothetical protein